MGAGTGTCALVEGAKRLINAKGTKSINNVTDSDQQISHELVSLKYGEKVVQFEIE